VLFVNVPIGVVAVLVTPFLISESRRDVERRSFDLPGAVTVTAGLCALVYGLVRTASIGWTSHQTIGVLAAATALLTCFVIVEQRSVAPLVPFGFFRNPNVSAANVSMLGAGAALVGLFYFLSLYMQKVMGYSAITAGLSQLPLAAGIIAAAGIASPLVTRHGARRVLVVGLAFFGAGLIWLAQLPTHGAYVADVLGPSLLIAFGLGLTFVPITILSMTDVEDRVYGLASGLVNTSQQIGGALGLAILSTIATTRINHLSATHHRTNRALTLGFHAAFLTAAGFVALATMAAATIGTRRNRKRAQSATV
jgi:hypothetical protein